MPSITVELPAGVSMTDLVRASEAAALAVETVIGFTVEANIDVADLETVKPHGRWPDAMTVCEPPCVGPEDVADAAAVRAILGIRSRATLIAYRRRDGFPAPWTVTTSGVELWDRRDIECWQRDQEEER